MNRIPPPASLTARSLAENKVFVRRKPDGDGSLWTENQSAYTKEKRTVVIGIFFLKGELKFWETSRTRVSKT